MAFCPVQDLQLKLARKSVSVTLLRPASMSICLKNHLRRNLSAMFGRFLKVSLFA